MVEFVCKGDKVTHQVALLQSQMQVEAQYMLSILLLVRHYLPHLGIVLKVFPVH